MSDPIEKLNEFLAELKRRKVYRVALAYVALAFVGLEAVDLLIPATTLPDWADEFFLALLIMGFPVAVVVAWAFELTPEGVRRTPPRTGEGAPERRAGRPSSQRWSRRATGAAVAFVLIAVAVVGGWYFLSGDRSGPDVTDRSIAVLPFETLGGEGTTTFTDGVHGDLLTRLSHVSGLSVISRTSVMRYRTPERPLPEIAGELGVAWVVHGEVQEAQDRVKVNARLVNARSDQQVWAHSYEGKLTAQNLFDIQAEITRQIAAALETRLSPQEERQVERAPTENMSAYRLYAEGRDGLDQRTESGIRKAIASFRRAIGRDSSFALAWVGLADGLSLLDFYDYPAPEVEVGAREAAERALELSPDLGEAHASLGIHYAVQREGPEAVRHLRRAVELRPSHAEAQIWLGWILLVVGQPREAIGHAEEARELNPFAPAVRAYLAEIYLANGRTEDALGEAVRARAIQPDYPLAHYMEGLVLYHRGSLGQADSVLKMALPLVTPEGTPSSSEVQALLAVTDAASGGRVAARERFSGIEETRDPFSVGLVHAALGDREAAFAAFERVSDWYSFATEHIRYFFPEVLGPIRADPRYEELLREVDRSWGLESDGSR